MIVVVGRVGPLKGMLNDVAVVPGVWPRAALEKVSERPFLVTGDCPLMESIETAGDIP
jgi:hypothetical protein